MSWTSRIRTWLSRRRAEHIEKDLTKKLADEMRDELDRHILERFQNCFGDDTGGCIYSERELPWYSVLWWRIKGVWRRIRSLFPWGRRRIPRFEHVAFPLVRRVYPNMIANEIVSVQPMTLPEDPKIFYVDYDYTSSGSLK